MATPQPCLESCNGSLEIHLRFRCCRIRPAVLSPAFMTTRPAAYRPGPCSLTLNEQAVTSCRRLCVMTSPGTGCAGECVAGVFKCTPIRLRGGVCEAWHGPRVHGVCTISTGLRLSCLYRLNVPQRCQLKISRFESRSPARQGHPLNCPCCSMARGQDMYGPAVVTFRPWKTILLRPLQI
jgi:hypothetical protein